MQVPELNFETREDVDWVAWFASMASKSNPSSPGFVARAIIAAQRAKDLREAEAPEKRPAESSSNDNADNERAKRRERAVEKTVAEDATTDMNGSKEKVNRRAVASAKVGVEKAKGKNLPTREKRPQKSPELRKDKRPRKSPEKNNKNVEKASKVQDTRCSPRNERRDSRTAIGDALEKHQVELVLVVTSPTKVHVPMKALLLCNTPSLTHLVP